ncbi:hypothetical protein AGLY_010857 [Aphis glycines]|uniref:Uncharacterized protein n=1 Tax=Aphis glycines TaxID=307491 RepID=A0A6G0TFN1_APHGL|nr:hypothetical protein AGLY_010857 [Aphis glycines]
MNSRNFISFIHAFSKLYRRRNVFKIIKMIILHKAKNRGMELKNVYIIRALSLNLQEILADFDITLEVKILRMKKLNNITNNDANNKSLIYGFLVAPNKGTAGVMNLRLEVYHVRRTGNIIFCFNWRNWSTGITVVVMIVVIVIMCMISVMLMMIPMWISEARPSLDLMDELVSEFEYRFNDKLMSVEDIDNIMIKKILNIKKIN